MITTRFINSLLEMKIIGKTLHIDHQLEHKTQKIPQIPIYTQMTVKCELPSQISSPLN